MYSLPSHLSQLARNLIPRMLEVDPMKRITITEIRHHPWFQHKLPPYLRHPPELVHGMVEKVERNVDPEVIEEVVMLPFPGECGVERAPCSRMLRCWLRDARLLLPSNACYRLPLPLFTHVCGRRPFVHTSCLFTHVFGRNNPRTLRRRRRLVLQRVLHPPQAPPRPPRRVRAHPRPASHSAPRHGSAAGDSGGGERDAAGFQSRAESRRDAGRWELELV